MNRKEYTLPNGKKAVFEYDVNEIGKVSLECMDMLMEMIADRSSSIDIVQCEDCKHNPKYTKDFQYGKCVCTCEDDWYSYEPRDDFFCGYGERIEE